jgi:SprT protein
MGRFNFMYSRFTLSTSQQQQVIDKTDFYIERANQLLNLQLPAIPVKFDLRGKSSGMFVYRRKGWRSQHWIRYNPIIFSQYFEHALQHTVGHEVAHYIAYAVSRGRKIKPHGKEWCEIMALFDLPAEVTSRYDVSELPLRQQRRHRYGCACREHELSTTRHNKILRGTAIYSCQLCHQPLRLLNQQS